MVVIGATAATAGEITAPVSGLMTAGTAGVPEVDETMLVVPLVTLVMPAWKGLRVTPEVGVKNEPLALVVF